MKCAEQSLGCFLLRCVTFSASWRVSYLYHVWIVARRLQVGVIKARVCFGEIHFLKCSWVSRPLSACEAWSGRTCASGRNTQRLPTKVYTSWTCFSHYLNKAILCLFHNRMACAQRSTFSNMLSSLDFNIQNWQLTKLTWSKIKNLTCSST